MKKMKKNEGALLKAYVNHFQIILKTNHCKILSSANAWIQDIVFWYLLLGLINLNLELNFVLY